ncbi:MAG: exodeoxyribonuclease VII large subunit [Ruminococcaceae bacterium]|nr:exodeoxyribonuclease VII large subunit [Oscillospiraceae bacterium]
MNSFSTPKFISVSQLNFYIKTLVEGDSNLRYVFVTGEISNLTDHYSSGHIYLSLKDDKAVVKAVMFANSARNLKFIPKNGMKVIVRGRVSVYEPSGQYQLYIEDMQPDGIGALTIAYEQLKAKLEAEGLFDNKYKKPLPKFPKHIAIITSPTGAALQDILNILRNRWPYAQVEIVPALVQGSTAASTLVKAVKSVDEEGVADVIIIGRGGGSIEDLWAFNDETLARTIFSCKIPVISSVGHETDFTICDFVADMRAPTPTAAAVLATPDKDAELDTLIKQGQYLSVLGENIISARQTELSEHEKVLAQYNPSIEFKLKQDEFKRLSDRLFMAGNKFIDNEKTINENLKVRLFALNPSEILKRGYSVTTLNNQTITSASQVNSGDVLKIILSDSSIDATVN